MGNLTELVKGVLEGCVMEIIHQNATYGYDITQQLRALGFEDVVEGTVYAITTRLERKGLVDVERQASEIGPSRKLYTLNAMGKKALEEFWQRWSFVAAKCDELRSRGNKAK